MKSLFIIFLSLLCVSSYSQKASTAFDLELGRLYDDLDRREAIGIQVLKETPEHIYVLRNVQKDKFYFWRNASAIVAIYELATEKDYGRYYLEKYDKTMRRIQSHLAFDAEKYNNDRVFFDAIEMQDTFYLFFTEKDGTAKKRHIYVQAFDPTTLKPLDPSSVRMHRLLSTSVFGESARQSGTFFLMQDEDKSKLAILKTIPGVEGKKAKFSVHVYGEGLQLLWEKEMKLPYDGKLFYFQDVLFDKQGNVHVLAKVRKEYNRDCYKKAKHHKWMLFTMYPDGRENKVRIDAQSDPRIHQMRIFQDKDSTILCLGTYTEECDFQMYFGGISMYVFKTDDMSKEFETYTPLDLDIAPDFMSKAGAARTRKRAEKGKESDFIPTGWRQTIFREDGSFIMLFENWGSVAQSVNIASFSATGKLQWGKYLWKGEPAEKPIFVSGDPPPIPFNYGLAIVDDKMYFVFNDNPKNEGKTLNPEEKPAKKMSGDKEEWALMVQVITSDGRVLPRKKIADFEKLEVIANPRGGSYLREGETGLLMSGEYRNDFRLFKLSFKGAFTGIRL